MDTIESLLPHYMQLWNLVSDGERFCTHSSLLQPVLYKDEKAMLKIPIAKEEKAGSRLMVWWNGAGVAKVYEYDENAILMERIISDRSLTEMSVNNQDSEASLIICNVASLLHSPQKEPYPGLIPLKVWFNDLFLFAEKYGETVKKCAFIAKRLLNDQRETVVLHGDLHHENILHSTDRGWLAIDPKGITGERTFDYVNILCNPNAKIALSQGRLAKQVSVISQAAGLSPDYLLKWTVAWCGLSSVWSFNDGERTSIAFDAAKIALNELDN